MNIFTSKRTKNIWAIIAAVFLLPNPEMICQQETSQLDLALIRNIKLSGYLALKAEYSPDGNFFFAEAYAGSFDPKTGNLRISMDQIKFIYDIKNNKKVDGLDNLDIVGMSDKNYLIIRNEGIKLWDYNEKEEIKYLFDDAGDIYISNDGKSAASVVEKKKIIVSGFNPDDDPVEYSVPETPDTIDGFYFKDSSSFWMISHSADQIKIINLINGQSVSSINYTYVKYNLRCISRNGNTMAVFKKDSVYFFDLGKSALIKVVSLPFDKQAVGLSNEGSFLFIACPSGEVVLFDIQKSVMIWKIGEHITRIPSLSVSPGEDAFITASFDSTVKLWKVTYK